MLTVQGLSFGFRHRALFRDVNFTLHPGELLHLVGPNGTGKSTLMAILAGLLAAQRGSIEFRHGENVVDDRRLYLEYLPAEANGLFLKMDATHNLQFWAGLRGRSLTREKAFAALERWNLNHPLLRDGFAVEKFSTGMKRRLALARLTLSPAPLWLLDEPLYGLDQQAASALRDLLQDHLRQGGLALVVSHDVQPLEGLISQALPLIPGRRLQPFRGQHT